MTVYARGYRPYEGGFGRTPAFWAIFREGYRTAARGKAIRRLRILFYISMAGAGMALYGAIGIIDWNQRILGNVGAAEFSWRILRETILGYYSAMTVMAALIAILMASGLVSDDLRTRALPLYTVRPIRPVDYALGKALILPVALLQIALLPGPVFLLLVALWQPPGETLPFLQAHLEVVTVCIAHYLLAAGSYTGLMLFLSSRTPRRAAVLGMAGAIIFVGEMLQLMASGAQLPGLAGDALRLAGIPGDTLVNVMRLAAEDDFLRRAEAKERLPDATGTVVLAAALLVIGFVATWRRARTVEVAG